LDHWLPHRRSVDFAICGLNPADGCTQFNAWPGEKQKRAGAMFLLVAFVFQAMWESISEDLY
jgi:hypothetical protein